MSTQTCRKCQHSVDTDLHVDFFAYNMNLCTPCRLVVNAACDNYEAAALAWGLGDPDREDGQADPRRRFP